MVRINQRKPNGEEKTTFFIVKGLVLRNIPTRTAGQISRHSALQE
jgi:hypothetical protein